MWNPLVKSLAVLETNDFYSMFPSDFPFTLRPKIHLSKFKVDEEGFMIKLNNLKRFSFFEDFQCRITCLCFETRCGATESLVKFPAIRDVI